MFVRTFSILFAALLFVELEVKMTMANPNAYSFGNLGQFELGNEPTRIQLDSDCLPHLGAGAPLPVAAFFQVGYAELDNGTHNVNSIPTDILAPYNPAKFAALPRFEDVHQLSREKLPEIHELLAIIDAHNLSSFLNVALLHRHFEIAPDEILVERHIHNRSEITVLNLDGWESEQAQKWPYMFAIGMSESPRFANEIVLHPLEFLLPLQPADDLDLEHWEVLQANLRLLGSSARFLKEFYDLLESFDLTDIFGLTVEHRFNLEHGGMKGTSESSDELERKLLVVAQDDEIHQRQETGNSHCEGISANVAWSSLSNKLDICRDHRCSFHSQCRKHCKHSNDNSSGVYSLSIPIPYPIQYPRPPKVCHNHCVRHCIDHKKQ